MRHHTGAMTEGCHIGILSGKRLSGCVLTTMTLRTSTCWLSKDFSSLSVTDSGPEEQAFSLSLKASSTLGILFCVRPCARLLTDARLQTPPDAAQIIAQPPRSSRAPEVVQSVRSLNAGEKATHLQMWAGTRAMMCRISTDWARLSARMTRAHNKPTSARHAELYNFTPRSISATFDMPNLHTCHGELTLTWEFPTIRGPNGNPNRRALIVRTPTKGLPQFIETATSSQLFDSKCKSSVSLSRLARIYSKGYRTCAGHPSSQTRAPLKPKYQVP